MDELKELLSRECSYAPTADVLDMLLSEAVEIRLRPNGTLIPYGKLDDGVYILKSGIIRYSYFDADKEKIWGFACPGTVMISYGCYYMHRPSFFQLEACRQAAVVLRVSKTDFDALLECSEDFAKWILNLSLAQLSVYEMKLSVISGTALEKFTALIENRPEIIRGVQQKHIASYLGVTPAYLSRLKNRKL